MPRTRQLVVPATPWLTTPRAAGGVAGLTVGNLLVRNGVGCVVLEKHSRDHVEQRRPRRSVVAGQLSSPTSVERSRSWSRSMPSPGRSGAVAQPSRSIGMGSASP